MLQSGETAHKRVHDDDDDDDDSYYKQFPQKVYTSREAFSLVAASINRQFYTHSTQRGQHVRTVPGNCRNYTFCLHYIGAKQFRFRRHLTGVTGWQSFGFVHHAIARQFQVSDCSQQTRRYTDKELEKLKDIHRYIHNLLENVNVIHKYTHK